MELADTARESGGNKGQLRKAIRTFMRENNEALRDAHKELDLLRDLIDNHGVRIISNPVRINVKNRVRGKYALEAC